MITVNGTYEREGTVIVSLGDSYSAGEGIEKFYGQDEPYNKKKQNSDWLAHRSENSWPGMLRLPAVEGTMAENRGTNWFFVAVSGATTEHMKGHQYKDTSSNIFDKETYGLDPQLNVFDNLGNRPADYVTLTLGGNDADFAKVITTAATSSTQDYLINNPNKLADQINSIWKRFYASGGIREKLKQAYKDIEKKAGKQAHIIVAGYPILLDHLADNPFFTIKEREIINDAVYAFNKEIESLVKECSAEGMKIHFVSVMEEFSGHEAYSDDPYINPVYLGRKDQDLEWFQAASSYSVHPNIKGARAYARCVQAKIDELEAAKHPRETSEERDAVLVLDVSGSMDGTPIKETKRAAEQFFMTVLNRDASVGVVTYSSSARMVSDFTKNRAYLTRVIDDLDAYGSTYTEAGLRKAAEMLNGSNAKKQIIVLMSDGEPNEGLLGKDLENYAKSLKDQGIIIYTLGFFEDLYEKSEAQQLMEHIASEGCHFEVDKADDLVFFFDDIAGSISGDKYIYVRIACPVDVTVSYKGETLSSAAEDYNTRTSFGSLTFTENENSAGSQNSYDDRVKVLRLKEGAKYNINIVGTGEGKMDYSIGFMDDNGLYSDMREFKDIPITPDTVINTVAGRSSSSVMNVDKNGDGKTDVKYKAAKNSTAVIVKTNVWAIIAIVLAAVIVLAAAVLIPVLVSRSRKRTYARPSSGGFCTYCGGKLRKRSAFCEHCGRKL
ncbi:MAG: VWA domain-containing protein [Clostridia bacterium]|nr:VWA domain-containing protein [Clostridia bacterium]